MALFSRGRPKKAPLWLRWLLRLTILLVVFTSLSQDTWWRPPQLDNWLCGRIATELNEQYGLVVRYGDPAEFNIAPTPPAVNDPEIGFSIGPANIHSALIALKGVRRALAKYPENLIKKYLSAVFIPGELEIYSVEAGGTLLQSWIYISATKDSDSYGPPGYEEIFHHELSSILMNGSVFPVDQWCAVNATDFKYLENKIDVIRAAEIENRADPSNAPLWYKAGFVHDYGMSSIHNDFNTYAELAMTQPEKLKQLAQQYPKIKGKTRILVDFYSSLAPELASYFNKCGLTESVAK